MKFLKTKSYIESFILLLSLYILLFIFSACSTGFDNSDEVHHHSSGTGFISFSLKWEPPPSASSSRYKFSPSGNICQDYGIEWISANVYDPNVTLITFGKWPCSDRKGNISDVPAGHKRRVIIEGIILEDIFWRGERRDISVVAGQTTYVKDVLMHYIGNDDIPPRVNFTNPIYSATDVPLDTHITVTFSEYIVSASIDPNVFILMDNDTNMIVNGSIENDPNIWSFTFIPKTNLSNLTHYRVLIKNSVQDMAGNEMETDCTWVFYTTSSQQIGDPPPSPKNVSVLSRDEHVEICWDPIPGTISYTIYMATFSGVSKTSYEEWDPNIKDTCYIWDDLTNETTYYFVVTARNNYGEGIESEEIVATPSIGASPTVNLNTPLDGSKYNSGEDDIYFNGSGYDFEDGALTGSSLIWTSNIDGEIGTGESFKRNDLSEGVHIITISATDSDGLTGSYSITTEVKKQLIILVPQDQPTIQAGIDAASDGDIIVVAEGTYQGEGNKYLRFKGKAVKVKSETGPENCIIDCEMDGGGFYFDQNERINAMLLGFTITNANNIGIYCFKSSPTIKDCIITQNNCGVLCYESSSPTIIDSVISLNSNSHNGGGISCGGFSSPNIINCIFIKNTSYLYGGAIYCQGSSPYIINCTITGNTADNGGGIYCLASNPTITNCILWNNSPGEIYVYGGLPKVTYSDIYDGWNGEGNIDAAPLFIDPGNDDYHLMPDSPCIDKGISLDSPGTDIEGNPRPAGRNYDMGAFEYSGPLPPENLRIIGVSNSVTLAWDAVAQADIMGYRIFLREEGQVYNYDNPVWEGIDTFCTILYLNMETAYYFVAKSFDIIGNQSANSNEVSYSPVNSLPIADNQFIITDEDTDIAIILVASDIDLDPLTYSVLTQPSHGTLSGTDPNLTYSPNSNYNGPDSFTFNANDGQGISNIATVSITIAPVNDAPEANDEGIYTQEDEVITGTLSASDADADGLTYFIVTNGSKGNAVITNPSSGAFTYIPDKDINGTDTFLFKVNDGTTDSAPATVTVNIAPVNDTPVANGQSLGTDENTAVSILLTGSDVDGDILNYTVVTQPSHGTLSGASPNLTYTPNTNYTGSDSFSFKVNDGSSDSNVANISITIYPVEGPPEECTTYEDAEDGNTDGWIIYDENPSGASINNVFDTDRQSRVIELTSVYRDYNYLLRNVDGSKWQNSTQSIAKWSLQYSDYFVVYFDVHTTTGNKYLYYTPVDFDTLGLGNYVHHGLGSTVTDGQWHSFERDLQADLEEAQPGMSILEVNNFMIYGPGRVDDIKLCHHQ